MHPAAPEEFLAAVEAAAVEAFGAQPQRASVTFLGVEPIEVLRFVAGEDDDPVGVPVVSYLTLGMSRRPMTDPDALVVATTGPRAELLLQVRPDQLEAWRRLAVLAASPAVDGVVYRAGMTVDLGEPIAPGATCTGGLVEGSALPPVTVGDETVEFFRLLPATQNELAWARVRGGAELQRLWAEQHTDLLDVRRVGATLEL